jgi:hypothetical protein
MRNGHPNKSPKSTARSNYAPISNPHLPPTTYGVAYRPIFPSLKAWPPASSRQPAKVSAKTPGKPRKTCGDHTTTANASPYGGHYDPATNPVRSSRLPRERHLHNRPTSVLCSRRLLRQETKTMKLLTRLALITALTIPVTAVVSPVEASQPWLCPKYTQHIKQTFPRGTWRTFDAIMHRESRCEPRAVGWNYHKGKSVANCPDGRYHVMRKCSAVRSWDTGLFQINSSWNTVTQQTCGASTRSRILTNVKCQFRVARVLYNHGGLAHWRGSSN